MEPIENKDRTYNYLDWVEKYRPKSVKHVILPNSIKKFFKDVVEKQEMPNLLLHSYKKGSGKTSLAKALCKDLGMKYLYINMSSENGIDLLRTTIQNFASLGTISGKPKCIIMDECERASDALQDGLKVAIEEHHKTCKFIMITNNVNKINDALRQGRTMEFNFDMTSPEVLLEMRPRVVNYLKKLLENEKVHYEDSALLDLVTKHYPSIRTCISILHQFYLVNGCINSNIMTFNDVGDEFFEFLFNHKFGLARKYILERNIPFTDFYGILYRKLIPKVDVHLVGDLIKIIDEQQYRSSLVADQEIALACCLQKIIEIL